MGGFKQGVTPSALLHGMVTLAAKWKTQGIGFYCMSLSTAVCFILFSLLLSVSVGGEHHFWNLSGSICQEVVETGFKPCGFVYPMWPRWTMRGMGAGPVDSLSFPFLHPPQLEACSLCIPAQELSVVPSGLQPESELFCVGF